MRAMNRDAMNPLDAMIESITTLFLHRWDVLPVRTTRGAFLLAYCPTEQAALDLVRSHVAGSQATANCFGGGRWFCVTDAFRVGSYLMMPESGVYREMAIDFDGESHGKPECLDAALGVISRTEELGLRPLLERSGSGTGWHIRFLMEGQTQASKHTSESWAVAYNGYRCRGVS